MGGVDLLGHTPMGGVDFVGHTPWVGQTSLVILHGWGRSLWSYSRVGVDLLGHTLLLGWDWTSLVISTPWIRLDLLGHTPWMVL